MSQFVSKEEITTFIDETGNSTTTKLEKSTSIIRNDEPDYIKIYTNMWCEFNGIPIAYRELFLQLSIRMSYCNSNSVEHSQWVNTGKPWSSSIMGILNWGEKMYEKGLAELRKCGAIKRIGRGVHQINPKYAGKGEWKYNPRLNRGGVEDLVAVFSFKNKSVDTKILWADDCQDDLLNEIYRNGLNAKKSDETILRRITSVNGVDEVGQAIDSESQTEQSSPLPTKSRRKSKTERKAV